MTDKSRLRESAGESVRGEHQHRFARRDKSQSKTPGDARSSVSSSPRARFFLVEKVAIPKRLVRVVAVEAIHRVNAGQPS